MTPERLAEIDALLLEWGHGGVAGEELEAAHDLRAEIDALTRELAAERYEAARVDLHGCYTLPTGDCVGCPHCPHNERSYDKLTAENARLAAKLEARSNANEFLRVGGLCLHHNVSWVAEGTMCPKCQDERDKLTADVAKLRDALQMIARYGKRFVEVFGLKNEHRFVHRMHDEAERVLAETAPKEGT